MSAIHSIDNYRPLSVSNNCPGRVRRETPDHLFIQARCDNGCSVGIEVAGNRPAASIFFFKIVGTKGELTLTGGHQHGYQSSDLKLEGTIPFDPPEPHAAAGWKVLRST